MLTINLALTSFEKVLNSLVGNSLNQAPEKDSELSPDALSCRYAQSLQICLYQALPLDDFSLGVYQNGLNELLKRYNSSAACTRLFSVASRISSQKKIDSAFESHSEKKDKFEITKSAEDLLNIDNVLSVSEKYTQAIKSCLKRLDNSFIKSIKENDKYSILIEILNTYKLYVNAMSHIRYLSDKDKDILSEKLSKDLIDIAIFLTIEPASLKNHLENWDAVKNLKSYDLNFNEINTNPQMTFSYKILKSLIYSTLTESWIQLGDNFILAIHPHIEIQTLSFHKSGSVIIDLLYQILSGIHFGIQHELISLDDSIEKRDNFVKVIRSINILNQYFATQFRFHRNNQMKELIQKIEDLIKEIINLKSSKLTNLYIPPFSEFQLDPITVDYDNLLQKIKAYRQSIQSIHQPNMFESFHMGLFLFGLIEEKLNIIPNEKAIECILALISINNDFLKQFTILHFNLKKRLNTICADYYVGKLNNSVQPKTQSELDALITPFTEHQLFEYINVKEFKKLFSNLICKIVTLRKIIRLDQNITTNVEDNFNTEKLNQFICSIEHYQESNRMLQAVDLSNHKSKDPLSNLEYSLSTKARQLVYLFCETIHPNINADLLNALEVSVYKQKLSSLGIRNQLRTDKENSFIMRTMSRLHIGSMLLRNLDKLSILEIYPEALDFFGMHHITQHSILANQLQSLIKIRDTIIKISKIKSDHSFDDKIKEYIPIVESIANQIDKNYIEQQTPSDDLIQMLVHGLSFLNLSIEITKDKSLLLNLKAYKEKLAIIFRKNATNIVLFERIDYSLGVPNIDKLEPIDHNSLNEKPMHLDDIPLESMPSIGLGFLSNSRLKPIVLLSNLNIIANRIINEINAEKSKMGTEFWTVSAQFFNKLYGFISLFERLPYTPPILLQDCLQLKDICHTKITDFKSYPFEQLPPFVELFNPIRIDHLGVLISNMLKLNQNFDKDSIKDLSQTRNMLLNMNTLLLPDLIFSPEQTQYFNTAIRSKAEEFIQNFNSTLSQVKRFTNVSEIKVFDKIHPAKENPNPGVAFIIKLMSELISLKYFGFMKSQIHHIYVKSISSALKEKTSNLYQFSDSQILELNQYEDIFRLHFSNISKHNNLQKLLDEFLKQVQDRANMIKKPAPLEPENDDWMLSLTRPTLTWQKQKEKAKKSNHKLNNKTPKFSSNDSHSESDCNSSIHSAEEEFEFIARMREFMNKQSKPAPQKNTHISSASAVEETVIDKMELSSFKNVAHSKKDHKKTNKLSKLSHTQELARSSNAVSSPGTPERITVQFSLSEQDFPALPQPQSLTSPVCVAQSQIKAEPSREIDAPVYSVANRQNETLASNSLSDSTHLPGDYDEANNHRYCTHQFEMAARMEELGLHYLGMRIAVSALAYARHSESQRMLDIHEKLYKLHDRCCDFLIGNTPIPDNRTYSISVHLLQLNITKHTYTLIQRGPNWFSTAYGILMEVSQRIQGDNSLEAAQIRNEVQTQCDFMNLHAQQMAQFHEQSILQELMREIALQRQYIQQLSHQVASKANYRGRSRHPHA